MDRRRRTDLGIDQGYPEVGAPGGVVSAQGDGVGAGHRNSGALGGAGGHGEMGIRNGQSDHI